MISYPSTVNFDEGDAAGSSGVSFEHTVIEGNGKEGNDEDGACQAA